MTNDDEITPEKVRELLENITPGKWKTDDYAGGHQEWRIRVYAIEDENCPGERTDIVSNLDVGGQLTDAIYNTDFIAAAPDIARAYLAECEKVTEEKRFNCVLMDKYAWALQENARLQAIIDKQRDVIERIAEEWARQNGHFGGTLNHSCMNVVIKKALKQAEELLKNEII